MNEQDPPGSAPPCKLSECQGRPLCSTCEKTGLRSAPVRACVSAGEHAKVVHDLETLCDPAGLVRENAQLRDTNEGLQRMYRAAKAEPLQGWVLIATDAYEAGFGKGVQAKKLGQEFFNPWGDEPGREAWSLGYEMGKQRADFTEQGTAMVRLKNLLAVAHGDGGHYLDEHGLDKACADAEEMIANFRAEHAPNPNLPKGW